MSTNHFYVLIPHIRVEHANALQAYWVMGPPSPMTVCGFVRALGMKIGVAFDAFSIIHHNVRWLAVESPNVEYVKKAIGGRDDKKWDALFWNRRVIPHQVQGATYINQDDHIGSGFSKGLQPTARCHVEMSLVLRAPLESEIDPQDIQNALWAGFFGGGSIVEHGTPVMSASIGDIKKALTSGYFVVDRADLTLERMQSAEAGGADALEVILDSLIAQPRTGPKANAGDGDGENALDPAPAPKSWLSANVVGYIALEEPKRRSGVRGNLPHAYAESLVGLIEYRPVRHSPTIPFWSYTAQPDRGAYFVRANVPTPSASNLHPSTTQFSI